MVVLFKHFLASILSIFSLVILVLQEFSYKYLKALNIDLPFLSYYRMYNFVRHLFCFTCEAGEGNSGYGHPIIIVQCTPIV